MTIPTEPIGSIPRSPRLMAALAKGNGNDPALEPLYEEAVRQTIDCGFSPFCDDTTTTRETAFAKIRSRVLGTELAAREIGG